MIFNRLLTNPSDVVNQVFDVIDKHQMFLLTYLNQHCYNVYCSNNEYRRLMDTKFITYQADQGIYLSLKYLFGKKINKIDATAMNNLILNKIIREEIPVAIVGGNFDENFVQANCEKNKINLVTYQNGYFDKKKSKSIIQELNSKQVKVYILGMGVPYQEQFAEKLSQNLNGKVIICVGNFLEFYFGTKKRAPAFIQKIGFEWLFRLFTDPRRFWNRYLIGIPLFFFRILKLKYSTKNIQ